MPAGCHVQIVPVWTGPTDVSDGGWHTTAVTPAGGRLPDRTASINPSHVFVMSALTLRTRRHPTRTSQSLTQRLKGFVLQEPAVRERHSFRSQLYRMYDGRPSIGQNGGVHSISDSMSVLRHSRGNSDWAQYRASRATTSCSLAKKRESLSSMYCRCRVSGASPWKSAHSSSTR